MFIEELHYLDQEPIWYNLKDKKVQEFWGRSHHSQKPLDPPQIPSGLTGKWSYEENQRLLLADFKLIDPHEIPKNDLLFLRKMMQRDDITVVLDGLIGNEDRKWYIENCLTVYSGVQMPEEHSRVRAMKNL